MDVPPAGSDQLHLAFNSDGMWKYPIKTTAGRDSTTYFGRDQYIALDHLLTRKDGLTLKFRKLVGVLLAASLFQLSDSPWIEQHLGPDTIFVPTPDKRWLQQWCPRVICTLGPKKDTKLQSDNIAAFGVLVLELEADRMASWTEVDNDWISGEKSNHVRLARILKSWEDYISDDYRNIAKACLEFDSLTESLDHPDIVSEMKGLAIVYKCILEPLFRHMMKSFGNLGPVFEKMFGPGRSLATPTSLSPSNTAKRILFDDNDSELLSKPEDQ